MKILKKIFNLPIKYYKYCLNHVPYMQQAIVKRGVLVGIILGIYRILRCNPFSKGGFDPVKNNYKGNAKWLL